MKTFTCENCGETFEQGRDDEEAKAEYRQLFAHVPETEPTSIVCEPCFEEIMKWAKEEGLLP